MPRPGCSPNWRIARDIRCCSSTTATSSSSRATCARSPRRSPTPTVGLVTCLYRAAAESLAIARRGAGHRDGVRAQRDGRAAAGCRGVRARLHDGLPRRVAASDRRLRGASQDYLADDYQLGRHISATRTADRVRAGGGRNRSRRRVVAADLAAPVAMVAHDSRVAAFGILRLCRHARDLVGARGVRGAPMVGRRAGARGADDRGSYGRARNSARSRVSSAMLG